MRVHSCKDELHAAGSKATPGRLALLGVLERLARPATVRQLERKLPKLNPTTLYRALESLVEAGLVRKGEEGRTARFEYADKPHHHHMKCVDCGFIRQCGTCTS